MEVSLELLLYLLCEKHEGSILVKRHIACPNRTDLCEKKCCEKHESSIIGKAHRVHKGKRFVEKTASLLRRKKKKKNNYDGEIVNLADSRMDCVWRNPRRMRRRVTVLGLSVCPHTNLTM